MNKVKETLKQKTLQTDELERKWIEEKSIRNDSDHERTALLPETQKNMYRGNQITHADRKRIHESDLND